MDSSNTIAFSLNITCERNPEAKEDDPEEVRYINSKGCFLHFLHVRVILFSSLTFSEMFLVFDVVSVLQTFGVRTPHCWSNTTEHSILSSCSRHSYRKTQTRTGTIFFKSTGTSDCITTNTHTRSGIFIDTFCTFVIPRR